MQFEGIHTVLYYVVETIIYVLNNSKGIDEPSILRSG